MITMIRIKDVSAYCDNSNNNLVSYYNFNIDGTDSKSSNTLTAQLGAYISTTGKLANSSYCDGTNDYWKTANDPFHWMTTTDFSYSFWIKSSDTSVNQHMLSNEGGHYVRYATAQLDYTTAGDGTGPLSGRVVNNTWQFIVMTYSHSTGKTVFYLDSSLIKNSSETDYPIDTLTRPFVVCAQYDGQNAYNTYFDELGVWNKSLTPSEVSLLYANGEGCNPLNLSSGGGTSAAFTSVNWGSDARPLNNTIWNTNQLNFTFNVTVVSVTNMNCTFFANATANDTFSNIPTTGNYNFSYYPSPNQNNRQFFNITCKDATNASRNATSTNKLIIIDRISPLIIITQPLVTNTQFLSTYNFPLNSMCSDTNLHEYEINISYFINGSIVWYDYVSGLTETSYINSNTTNSSSWGTGLYKLNFRCADNHNPLSFNSSNLLYNKIDNTKILFNTSQSKMFLKVSSNDVTISKMNITLTKDGGYKVGYDLKTITGKELIVNKLVSFVIDCNKQLTIVNKEIGHFLCGDKFNKLSIDFEEEIKSGNKISVLEINKTAYTVFVTTSNLFIDPYIGGTNNAYETMNVSLYRPSTCSQCTNGQQLIINLSDNCCLNTECNILPYGIKFVDNGSLCINSTITTNYSTIKNRIAGSKLIILTDYSGILNLYK